MGGKKILKRYTVMQAFLEKNVGSRTRCELDGGKAVGRAPRRSVEGLRVYAEQRIENDGMMKTSRVIRVRVGRL